MFPDLGHSDTVESIRDHLTPACFMTPQAVSTDSAPGLTVSLGRTLVTINHTRMHLFFIETMSFQEQESFGFLPSEAGVQPVGDLSPLPPPTALLKGRSLLFMSPTPHSHSVTLRFLVSFGLQCKVSNICHFLLPHFTVDLHTESLLIVILETPYHALLSFPPPNNQSIAF